MMQFDENVLLFESEAAKSGHLCMPIDLYLQMSSISIDRRAGDRCSYWAVGRVVEPRDDRLLRLSFHATSA